MKQIPPDTLAALSAGATAWSTQENRELELPSLTMNDGPHGVRKVADVSNLDYSIPATAFPTTACLAGSWDTGLIERVGAAVGRECRELGVQILLGPGLNIKRSPLGGRNFEYYSEDPVLSGELAAAFIRGVQSRQVAATIKHFTANNAEYRRMTVQAIIDERTLREIYLPAFERAIRRGKPWALMTAYNKLNGEYCTQSKWLLTDILRDEWGYDGLTMSDWGAVDDRISAITAGLDLEMPGPSPHYSAELAAALAREQKDRLLQPNAAEPERRSRTPLSLEDAVQRSISSLKRLASRVAAVADGPVDAIRPATAAEHHVLAREAAAAGMVLLQNTDSILPFEPASVSSLAVIGRFADEPRFQGGGSSQMNPTGVESALQHAKSIYRTTTYTPGYQEDGALDVTGGALQDAQEAAKAADAALLFVGLPDNLESEGFDRSSLLLPPGQLELIMAVCAVQPRTAVVIIAGSAVDVRWKDAAPAILYAGLAGQAGGAAVMDIVSGSVAPRGRLTESFPLRIEDTPCNTSFPGEGDEARYSEGIFVGYRYYESFDVATAFPFGHGLGYTDFSYSNPKLTTAASAQPKDATFLMTVTVTNTGARTGTEVVQLYIRPPESTLRRPVRELRGFQTITLKPGESGRVEIPLTMRDLCAWDPVVHAYAADPGTYYIEFGASAHDIRHSYPLPLVDRIGPRRVLNEWDSIGDWLAIPAAVEELKQIIPADFIERLREGSKATDEMFRSIPLKKMAQFFPHTTSPKEIIRMVRRINQEL